MTPELRYVPVVRKLDRACKRSNPTSWPYARSLDPRLAIASESPPIDKDRNLASERLRASAERTVEARVAGEKSRVNRSRPTDFAAGTELTHPTRLGGLVHEYNLAA
jgi:hypothetical protein